MLARSAGTCGVAAALWRYCVCVCACVCVCEVNEKGWRATCPSIVYSLPPATARKAVSARRGAEAEGSALPPFGFSSASGAAFVVMGIEVCVL